MLNFSNVENIKPIDTSQFSQLVEKYSPFVSEVKKRLVYTLVVFSLATISGFILYEKVIGFLIRLLDLERINVVFTSPFQFISLSISCGVATGLVVTFPFLIFQILNFLKPALKIKEYKTITRFLPATLILFMAGFVFGALIMKWQIELFISKSLSLGIGNVLDISSLLIQYW